MLGFFYGSPQGNPVEAVEYFMVGIAANLVFLIYETVVYILTFYKYGQRTAALAQYGKYTVQLGLLFAVYIDLVTVLNLIFNILGQQIEVLVEYRLGSNIEIYWIRIL